MYAVVVYNALACPVAFLLVCVFLLLCLFVCLFCLFVCSCICLLLYLFAYSFCLLVFVCLCSFLFACWASGLPVGSEVRPQHQAPASLCVCLLACLFAWFMVCLMIVLNNCVCVFVCLFVLVQCVVIFNVILSWRVFPQLRSMFLHSFTPLRSCPTSLPVRLLTLLRLMTDVIIARSCNIKQKHKQTTKQ